MIIIKLMILCQWAMVIGWGMSLEASGPRQQSPQRGQGESAHRGPAAQCRGWVGATSGLGGSNLPPQDLVGPGGTRPWASPCASHQRFHAPSLPSFSPCTLATWAWLKSSEIHGLRLMFQHWMNGAVTNLSLHSVAKGRVSSMFVSCFGLNHSKKWRAKAAAVQTPRFTRSSLPRRYFLISSICFLSVSHCYSVLQQKKVPHDVENGQFAS